MHDGGLERNSAAYLFEVAITLTEAGLAAAPGALLCTISGRHSTHLLTASIQSMWLRRITIQGAPLQSPLSILPSVHEVVSEQRF